MKKVTRKITVDLSRKSHARVVFATQNDLNSRLLSITLTDDGKPYHAHKELTATVNFRRSDEKYGSYLAKICDDGTVEYLISPTILFAAGRTECTVSLFNDIGNKLTSSSFFIDVAQTLYPEYELSEDPRLDFVDEMIGKFTDLQNDENARKDAELLRDEAEEERALYEGERNKAEKQRETAEEAREQGEKTREATEQSRVEAEQHRAQRIQEYDQAEEIRDAAEVQRVWGENQREYAERIRVASESDRRTAERARQAAFLNIDRALDVVLEIQNSLIGGDK